MSNVCFINTKYNTVVGKICKEEDEKKNAIYDLCLFPIYYL